METEFIPIGKLEPNTGQIKGLPKNPRLIKDKKFEKLVKSLHDDPEMLEIRELMVFPVKSKFVVIGGNMRLQAMKELGFKEAPCKILPKFTPVEKLKAYTIKDNIGYGNDDWDTLQAEWDIEQLEDWGMDVPDFRTEKEPEDIGDEVEIEYKVEIVLENEEAQQKAYNYLIEKGYECRILTL